VEFAIADWLTLAINFKVSARDAEAIKSCIAIVGSICKSEEDSDIGIAI
jgi:hypothetical protein